MSTCARPSRYHRRASLIWQAALRRLVGKGLTDSRVAELLSGLSESTLRQLDSEGWILERVEDLHVAGSCPLPWSVRSVGHHRRRLGLPANHAGLTDANAAKRLKQRLRQIKAGLWHLLPDPDSSEAGLDLWQTECTVLSLLRDRGPMTRRELLGELGRRRLLGPHGRSIFSRLVEAGLVELHQGDGTQVYVIAEKCILPFSWHETKYG